MRADRPNILFMIPHDLGDFLGCYGHETVSSPHLDRLAAEGALFRNYFTPTPECTASRGCMMTGYYPHQNGLMGLANFGWSLRVPHLAERLSDAGYATHLFGLQHETADDPKGLGYGHVHSGENREAETVCENLCAFLRKGSREAEPWFAHAGFRHVHRNWKATTRFSPEAVEVPPWLPDDPVVRKDLACFHQDIEDLDTAIGQVLATLAETGQAENTLVVFTVDHGAPFPGAKASFYDPGVHVPLIMRWPGQVKPRTKIGPLISNIDLTPTLLELAGAPVPGELAGRSFLPLLQGQEYTERDCVHGALHYDVAYDPMHYVRTKTHKYIRSFAITEEDAKGVDPMVASSFEAGRWVRVDDLDVLSSPSWQALSPAEKSPKPPREELYDLRVDPLERVNLAEDPSSAEVLAEMRHRLHEMMVATVSPLLNGHVPPPEKQCEMARHYTPGSVAFVAEVEKRQELIAGFAVHPSTPS